jgi:hypothetical protein
LSSDALYLLDLNEGGRVSIRGGIPMPVWPTVLARVCTLSSDDGAAIEGG